MKNYDIIIPVPISIKRKKKRGYNQSELIAKQLAKQMRNLKYIPKVLYKIKDTIPQSILDKEKRIENIRGAYYIKNGEILKNRKILLIDDIYTTGSTIDAAASVLLDHGAEKVYFLSISIGRGY